MVDRIPAFPEDFVHVRFIPFVRNARNVNLRRVRLLSEAKGGKLMKMARAKRETTFISHKNDERNLNNSLSRDDIENINTFELRVSNKRRG